MVMAAHTSNPAWTIAAPVVAAALAAAKTAGLVPADSAPVLALAAALMLAAVFAAVHHAELLAVKLGDPFGSILLAVAVTVIEVALIVSIMISGAEGGETVARDTVFAAVMIVLNGVVGVCLLLGGRRHLEQRFQVQGASSALAVLGTLAVISLVLPNFTVSTGGPTFSTTQALVVGAAGLALWAVFVFVQTVRHRAYFIEIAPADAPATPAGAATGADPADHGGPAHEKPGDAVALASLALLLVSLTAVILLAKVLSHPLDDAVLAAGLPQAFVGVVIAAIVLLPEGLAAAKSAIADKLQNSINLAVGSAIASIGLTVPTVAFVAIAFDQNLVLGVSPANMTLLLLTLFVSTVTLGTGRTTVLQGAVHLVIFAVFLTIAAIP
jgi:Ca2+:H+ antiporter